MKLSQKQFQKGSHREFLEFSPGLLSIQESPPRQMPRGVLYAVSLLFLILLIWASVGKLDIIVSAEGRLVPQTYIKVVQPSEAGIVKELLVREGQTVTEGEVLVRMDPVEAHADAAEIRDAITAKSLELRRIDAELTGVPMTRNESDQAATFATVDAQYVDRRQAYLDAVDQARQALSKAKNDYAAAKEVYAKLEQTYPILKDQADSFSNLGKEGYAAKVTVADKQRALVENQQDLRAQASTVSGLAAAVTEATRHLSEVTSKYRSDLQNERVTADSDLRKLQQDSAKQDHKVALLELRAPVAGVVKDLSTHTVGTVVSAGSVLLSLVPESEPMLADVMIKNEDVGFVVPQQKVRLKLAAYPFQKYGMIDGEVQQVWPDARDEDGASSDSKGHSNDSSSDETGKPLLGYRALVSLAHQQLVANGATLKLVPGMQVVAEINQGRRTVLEYLLSPVERTLAEGGREH